jgi:pantoate--beta-alanine ligase
MKIVKSVSEMADLCAGERSSGRIMGFVPTMGYLHAGHMSLVRASVSECGLTAVSVFVNPTQFSPGEDLKKYPRNLERDISLLEKEKVDLVFIPEERQMYPDGYSTFVDVDGSLTERLCGASRPRHFRGVATVVTKLLNIVEPTISYFGQKDLQQALVIRRMVSDLNMKTIIKVMPTVREPDGLAMSSRNSYLSASGRMRASLIFKALDKAREIAESGQRNSGVILKEARDVLFSQEGVVVDYLEVVNWSDLSVLEYVEDKAYLMAAVFVDGTRLIDNIEITAKAGGNKNDKTGI